MELEEINPPQLPKPAGTISHGLVLRDAGLVFVSGQVAWDADRALIGRDDLAAQFRKANENVDHVLKAAGTSRNRIVKETIYLVGYTPTRSQELISLLKESRREDRPLPTSTVVGVPSLSGEGFLVEIEAIAALNSGSR